MAKRHRHPRTVNTERAAQIVSTQQWSGPLPPPADLEQFNQIIPNGAERIFKLVEAEQAHRMEHERAVLVAIANDTRRGQWLGGIIAVVAMVATIISVWLNAHPAVSVALVGVPVLGIVKAIVDSRSKK